MELQATHAPPQSERKPHLFSIKPYGDNLCTPGASYWIACIRLVIVVMALSEAIAWGYLGSLFGNGLVGYVAAFIAFLFVFLIIWIIDVSFVTLDLSRAHYDQAILKKKQSTWADNTKVSIGLLGRVAIVVVSLSISAPFIAQIVFMQDIDNEMERRNLARVDMVGDSLLAQKDVEVAALDSLILVRESELVTETAGQGASGNYGFGPVTQAMERNIQRLKDERRGLLTEKEEMAEAFRGLTLYEFAEQYNVDLVDNGVQARAAILTSLSDNPEYRQAKRAITAFLAFIFAALVLLKLFQPRSVKIYYNEKLQDLYKEYLTGNLNKWIAQEEQYRGDGQTRMSPLRFEDWCINTYSVVRSEDIKRRDSSKIYSTFKMKVEQLEGELNEVRKMLEPVEQDHELHLKELNIASIALMEAKNAIEQNERNRADVARQLKGIDADLKKGNFRGEDLLHAVQAKKNIEGRLTQHKKDALQLQHDLDIATHKHAVKQAEVEQSDGLISRIRTNHRNIQEKIDRERLNYTDMVVSGAVVGTGLIHAVPETAPPETVEPEAATLEEALMPALEAPVSAVVDKVHKDETKEMTNDTAIPNTGAEEDTFVTDADLNVNEADDTDSEDVDSGSVDSDITDSDNTNAELQKEEEPSYQSVVEEFLEDEDEDRPYEEYPSTLLDEETPVVEAVDPFEEEETVQLVPEKEPVVDEVLDPFYEEEPSEYVYDEELPDAFYVEDEIDDIDLDDTDEDKPEYAFDESDEDTFVEDLHDQEDEPLWDEYERDAILEDENTFEEDEKDKEDEPAQADASLASYPLLLNGAREIGVSKPGPVTFVDNEALERYADAASLAAYDEEQPEAREEHEPWKDDEQPAILNVDASTADGEQKAPEDEEENDWFADLDAEPESDAESDDSQDADAETATNTNTLEPEDAESDTEAEAPLALYQGRISDNDEDVDAPEDYPPLSLQNRLGNPDMFFLTNRAEHANPFEPIPEENPVDDETPSHENVDKGGAEESESQDAAGVGATPEIEAAQPDREPEESPRGQIRTKVRRRIKPGRSLGAPGDWMIR